MFEKIIASFLKRFVARYVDINADQLSVQLLYGRPIVVENLTFHRSALNFDIRTKLKLPIEIESLHVGKIQCSFVWSSLFFRSTSAAFIIRVENVRAIIKPIVLDDHENDEFNETNENSREQKKKTLLDLAEQQLEKEFEYLGQIKSSSWSIRRLILSFLEKIQIQIIDVDICYRSFTSDNISYKVGLAFDNIQISNDLSNENMNRKVFQVQNLGFYVDSETPVNTHQYLLVPLNSMKIFLTQNYFRSSLVNRRQPRYELKWTFDDLNLKTDAEQIRILSDVVRFIQYATTHRKFINNPSRPDEKVSKKNVKFWWRYVTLVIIRTQNYLKTPIGNDQTHTTTNFWFQKDLFCQRLKQLSLYKRFYRSYLDQKSSKRSTTNSLTDKDFELMKQIEMEFDLNCLLRIRRFIFRERANEQVHLRQNQTEPTSSWYMSYAYWISNKVVETWRTGPSTNDVNANPTPIPTSMIPLNENDQRLQEQVNTFIAQSLEDQDLSQNRRDALYLRLEFALTSVQIDLLAKHEPIFDFSLNNVSVLTELRSRYQSVLFYLRLDDLNIRDRVRTDAFSTIVCPKQRHQESSMSSQRAPVFELSFESNPPSQQSNTKRLSFAIAVRSRGLGLVCCPMSVERLRDFFLSAYLEPISQPAVPASPAPNTILQHWTHLKDRTTKQIRSAFEQLFSTSTTAKMSSTNVKNIKQGQRRSKKRFEIYLDICAPQTIFPQSSDRALIMDFGYLTFFNDEYSRSNCPLKNCDMHNSGSTSPSTLTDYFQQRPYFFNEQVSSPVTSNSNDVDDDNEEFCTPDSSPSATDDILEVETTNYPINVIPREQSVSPVSDNKNLHYSSFSLSLCDMQLGYLTYSNNQASNRLSSIIEKFGVCFLIQYRTVKTFDQSLPLVKVSGTLPKIIVQLDPLRIETIGDTIHQWDSFISKLTPTIKTKSDSANSLSTSETLFNNVDARLSVDFRINEISVRLSDELRALSEIRVENIALTVFNQINKNTVNFRVQTLMIADAIQNHGKDYELLLTSNRALEINTETGSLDELSKIFTNDEDNYLIRVDIISIRDKQTGDNDVKIEVHVNKLHLVFNPETLSILTNFIVETSHRIKTIRRQPVEEQNAIQNSTQKKNLTTFQINSEFQELSILFVNVLTIKAHGKRFLGTKLEKIAAARIKGASLNVTLEPSTFVEAEICVLQMFNLLQDSSNFNRNEQTSAIVDLGTDEKQTVCQNVHQDELRPVKAFYLSFIKQKEEDRDLENLSIEIASVCYTHSPKIISKLTTMFKYIAQHSHSSAAIQMKKVKQNVLKQGTMLLNQIVLPNESVSETDEISRQLKLNFLLATPILIFGPQSTAFPNNDRLVFHLGDIRIENDDNQPSTYGININNINFFSIDLEHEFRHNQGVNLIRMYKEPHHRLRILDNVSVQLYLQLSDSSMRIDSKLLAPVQMFLGKHQITLLQQVISSLTYDDVDQIDVPLPSTPNDDSLLLFDQEDVQRDDSSSNKAFKTFAMHFELPTLILVFQADLELEPTNVCQAIFTEFHMSFEQPHPYRKKLNLRLKSLQIIDNLVKVDQCLFSTRCRRNSSSNHFFSDHFLASSAPTEKRSNHRLHDRLSPSSVPAYMENNQSSTWTLSTLMSSSIRSTSVSMPAFIDIDITLMDKRHEDYKGLNIIAVAQFGEVNIEFVISTWVMLFDIIGLIGGRPQSFPTGSSENKDNIRVSDTDLMQISIHIDAVSCLLHDDHIPPIRISLQRFNCEIQNILTIEKALKTLTIDGNLGSVSVRDLSPFGQLYEERFCTSGTNALKFIYTKEEDLQPEVSANFPSRLQLYLRMTSVQYIHTQRFLMDLIHFFDRFHHSQDCYNRIRSAAAGQVISCTAGRSTGIKLNIEAGSPILILPEYALNKPVIALHLGHIIIKNDFLFDGEEGTLTSLMNKERKSKCLLDVINIQFEDTQLYSAMYCKLDSNIKTTVQFSTFGFHPVRNDRSSMLRENAHLNIQIERNLDSSLDHSSPTFSVKADLSSVDILVDTSQYALVRGILAYNLGEQLEQPTRSAMIVDDPRCVSTILTGDVYLDMIFIIQMINVGFEIFIPNDSNLYSLGYCAFSRSSFSFEKYSNNDQVLDLRCSSIILTDTRKENTNEFRDILTSSSSSATSTSQMQLEIHLKTNKIEDKYTIVLNHTRILFIVDWLLKLNDFLSSFQQSPMSINPIVSTGPTPPKKLFEIRLNVNQSELVLVQTTQNPQSNALVLSGVMTLTYRESQKERPLDCTLFNVTLFSCQMNQIQTTAVSIIEPININFNIHLSKDKHQRLFELNLPKLFIRLSYTDVKLMLYMFRSIQKQIDLAQLRETIPKYTSISIRKPPLIHQEILTEFCPLDGHSVDFPVRSAVASPLNTLQVQQSIDETKDEKPATTFLNLHAIKFHCEQISLCLIDDCLTANIPLLNINLTHMKLSLIEYETFRFQQAEFGLNIFYYNRLLSGYEPFIESWPLTMTLKTSSNLTQLTICSNHVLNINYTKTMHQLYDLVKNNWLEDFYQTNDSMLENISFRQPKPFEPYCFKNLIGQRLKFRTWLSSQQRYDHYEHSVEYNETKSFIFPSESSSSKLQTQKDTSSYSDRRLLITIDGWESLKPISIDHVGTFFRLALPSGDQSRKPVLVFIDVTMADSSMRSITIRSAIQIRNQLLTSIDVRLKCGPGSLRDLRLESNETLSLPIDLCPDLRQFQVRPTDFGLNYCGEPISWADIVDDSRRRRPQSDENDEQSPSQESHSLSNHRAMYTTNRQSFFRTCTMNVNEAIYFVCIQSKRTRLLAHKDQILASYELSILSPLIINNLLPCDLFFQIYPNSHRVRLNPYKSHREHGLNIDQAIDIVFGTDLYHMEKPLRVPSINDLSLMRYFFQNIPFYDSIKRVLLVNVTIACSIRHRLKITVSVPYILLNKSGIPLIFKQEGTSSEAAGQTHEHELARNREPLLFSFSDPDASHACVMKIGSGLHKNDDGRPVWSQRFSLERGSNYRQLYVRSPHGSPDWIYYIAIDVRQGKGRLRRTNYIFLSTRFMISNQCSHDLLIAQRHIVRAMIQAGDDHIEGAQSCLQVLKHSNVAYHWPRSDLDQLLCVRVINNIQYRHVYWSGGFLIDRVNAFHINLRYDNNQCLILRVQVIERGGTFFVVFMDSNQMPAPLRIVNLSDVPIQFYQSETREKLTYLRTFIQPHQSIDYAWDEITLKQTITCSVVGGTKETYDLQRLGHGENLCYENHICLALEQTFVQQQNSHRFLSMYPSHNIRSSNDRNILPLFPQQHLVIDFIQGKLVLAQKEENKRSQLWRMTSSGVLVHTGSSSPRDWSNKNDTSDDIQQASVLDIEEISANHPYNIGTTGRFNRLTIRRYDPRRAPTQTWTFHEDGYLCMGKSQMCVQVFGDLRENTELVLGLRRFDQQKNPLPPLPTMHIRPRRRLKGSGLLAVQTYADGPTRVLEISDVKASNPSEQSKTESQQSSVVSKTANTTTETASTGVHRLELRLEAGIGVSIISSMGYDSEELVYMILNDIHLKYNDENNDHTVDATIGAIIISNQLVVTSAPCLLYMTYDEDKALRAAVQLQARLQKPTANYKQLHIFRYLNINLNPIIVQLDELLLWKLVDFLDINFSSSSSSTSSSSSSSLLSPTNKKTSNTDIQTYDFDEGGYDTQRLLSLLTSTQATRIYFNDLYLSGVDLNLSVYCGNSRSLPAHLLNIKRRAPFPLIRFENAPIHLKSYENVHIFNTYDFFLLALTKHYVDELKRQAFKILGSVDFLGNPLGLFNDVTDGVASLMDHGSVTGLVRNVAHGVADSASKFTGTLSYGIGKLTLDQEHDDMREAIANNYRGSSIGHVIGGTVGLAAGVVGGLTSLITQPYKGVVEDGVSGLAIGFVKGLFGTVGKPVVGILDFANGLALAVREGSRSSNSILRSRIRNTRCPTNIFGLLQPFLEDDAYGQSLLYQMNQGSLGERYITRLLLSRTLNDSLPRKRFNVMTDDEFAYDRRSGLVYVMITSQRVIIYRTEMDKRESEFEVTVDYDFSSISEVKIIEDSYCRSYLRFFLHGQSRRLVRMISKNDPYSYLTIFRCDLHDDAARFIRDVKRAHGIFDEEKLTYIQQEDENINDDDDDDDIPGETPSDETTQDNS